MATLAPSKPTTNGAKTAPGRAYPAPKQLATPTDLKPDAVQAITEAVNGLVADAFALYLKTKNFHWHMSGSHFRDYHLLLDEHGDQIFAVIDPLAERVRKLGGTTLRSISHVSALQSVADNNDEFVSPDQMIAILRDDNKDYTASLRKAHEICEDGNDVATASLLEVFIDETERRTWFLNEVTIGGKNEL